MKCLCPKCGYCFEVANPISAKGGRVGGLATGRKGFAASAEAQKKAQETRARNRALREAKR